VLFPEGGDRVLTIETAAPVADGPGWWLTFREFGDRAAADALRDLYLEAAVERSQTLPSGEVFWHEVVGARVVDLAGRELGTVADVYRAGVAEVYVVRGGPVGEFDLPVIRDVIREFAPERGLIVVDEAVLALEEKPVDDPRRAQARDRRPRWSRHGKGRAAPDDGGPAAEGRT